MVSLRMSQTNGKDEHLTAHLSDVLAECRTMITTVGIIFGFLLNVALTVKFQDPIADTLLWIAVWTSLVSVMLFSMPVIYHHAQFPYKSREKFILRSHTFMIWGLLPFLVTLFLGLTLAFYQKLGTMAFALSLFTFLILGLIYHERNRTLTLELYPNR
ncbi:TPA: hypothetical protein HA318_05845 [Candidatus Micrarchaeota archaeon]|nr:hypothetical protein [Candidatus Micrarchaeota archaeon]